MKKFTFKLIAILLISMTMTLESKSQGIGIVGGMNFSTISTDLSSSNQWRVGYQAGIFGKFMMGDNWSFQPRLMYSTKGSVSVYDKEFLGGDVEEAEITFKTQYISLPLLVNFNPYKNLNVYIGPFAGYLLNGEVESDDEILQYMNVQENNGVEQDDFNNVDVGLQAGIGMEIDPFIVGVDYSFSFIPVADQDRKLEMILEDANNNTVSVMVGVMF